MASPREFHASFSMTTDLAIRVWEMAAKRDRKGWKWCRDFNVGKMRADFGLLPKGARLVIDSFTADEERLTASERRMSVRAFGSGMCNACPSRFAKCPYHPDHEK